MKMIDHVCAATVEYIDHMPKDKRKKYGQFFTSKETAVFMAGLFSIPEGRTSLSILDPGAGSGILSVALLERLESNAEIDSIELVCYENDANIVDLLYSNLEWACSHITKDVSFRIVTDNYILSQMLEYNGMLGASPEADKFDMVIGNPAYMKIAKNAPEATTMPDVCYGAPNLYFLFAAMSMFDLKAGGEMVYIIPRSWTSGTYFKQFRKRFFEESALEHILKCFVLVDLKTSKITHQDVGQMDMYIRMYDELKRGEGDNPTIGIVLCSDTDEDIAKYSVLHGNEQLFASKYKLYLPTEEELRAEIEMQKEMFYLQQDRK